MVYMWSMGDKGGGFRNQAWPTRHLLGPSGNIHGRRVGGGGQGAYRHPPPWDLQHRPRALQRQSPVHPIRHLTPPPPLGSPARPPSVPLLGRYRRLVNRSPCSLQCGFTSRSNFVDDSKRHQRISNKQKSKSKKHTGSEYRSAHRMVRAHRVPA